MRVFLVFFILISTILLSQTPDSVKHYYLGEVEITASKEKELRTVSVSMEDFIRQNSVTAYDGLQFRPGIYASVSGKNDAQLSIRGFDQRQISVMIDGAPIYIPYDGSFDLNAIQLAGFSRISVSKSTHTILYGPNSMGGNINLISSVPVQGLTSRLSYRKGLSDVVSAGIGFANPLFYLTGSFGYFDTKGYDLPKSFVATANEDGSKRDNSEYTSIAGQFKIGTNIVPNTNLAFGLNLIDNKKGVPVNIYTTRPRYWRYSDWNKTLANFMFNSSVSSFLSFKGNVFYEKFMNVLDSFDDATYTVQKKKSSFHSTYDDHSIGINISAFLTSDFFPLTKFIFLYKRDTHNEQGNYNQLFKKYEADILTFGAEEEFGIAKGLRSIIGLSYDRMKPLFADNAPLRQTSASINGNAGLYYSITPGAEIYLSLARKSRFPTLKEFYSELLGSYVANPDLKAEQNFSFEAGGNYRFQNIIVAGAFFYNDVTDLLQIVSLGNNLRQYKNINKALITGVEMEVSYVGSYLNAAINYTFMSAKNKTENVDLINRPAHIINFIANKLYEFGLQWTSEVSFVSEQQSVNSDNGAFVKLPDYLVINLGVSQRIFSHFAVDLRINNLTDKLYETEYGFPRPGREFSAGISAEW